MSCSNIFNKYIDPVLYVGQYANTQDYLDSGDWKPQRQVNRNHKTDSNILHQSTSCTDSNSGISSPESVSSQRGAIGSNGGAMGSSTEDTLPGRNLSLMDPRVPSLGRSHSYGGHSASSTGNNNPHGSSKSAGNSPRLGVGFGQGGFGGIDPYAPTTSEPYHNNIDGAMYRTVVYQSNLCVAIANNKAFQNALVEVYGMSPSLVKGIVTWADAQSLMSRCDETSISFKMPLAKKLLSFIHQLLNWYKQRHSYAMVGVSQEHMPSISYDNKGANPHYLISRTRAECVTEIVEKASSVLSGGSGDGGLDGTSDGEEGKDNTADDGEEEELNSDNDVIEMS